MSKALLNRAILEQCSSLLLFRTDVHLRKVKIYLLTSCNTEERIAQNIYIHNSNRNYKKNYLQQHY